MFCFYKHVSICLFVRLLFTGRSMARARPEWCSNNGSCPQPVGAELDSGLSEDLWSWSLPCSSSLCTCNMLKLRNFSLRSAAALISPAAVVQPRVHLSTVPQQDHRTFYEFRTYCIRPDQNSAFLKLTNEKIHLRTAHSKLIGYWSVEYGGLNQVFHIWKYGEDVLLLFRLTPCLHLPLPDLTCLHLPLPDLTSPHLSSPALTRPHLSSPVFTCPSSDSYSQRAGVRAALAQDPSWISDYISKAMPMLTSQDNEVTYLVPWSRLQAPPLEGGVYELVSYQMRPGGPAVWGDTFQAAVISHDAPGYGKLVGAFHSEFGHLNRVHALWWFQSADHRAELRRKSHSDARVVAAVRNSVVHLNSQENKLMLPNKLRRNHDIPKRI
ncbi:hypothetical protein INR49_009052, partial [Caranx melampygus]